MSDITGKKLHELGHNDRLATSDNLNTLKDELNARIDAITGAYGILTLTAVPGEDGVYCLGSATGGDDQEFGTP